MLCRQWQFGEFIADDAGSAAFAQVSYRQSPLTLISHRHQTAVPLDNKIPLEVEVEHEAIDYSFDLELRIEIGQQFIRILRKELASAGVNIGTIDSTIDQFLSQSSLQFALPQSSDPDAARILGDAILTELYHSLVGSGCIDGSKLLQALKVNGQSASSLLTNPTNTSDINKAGNALLQWFSRVYSQPTNEEQTAWHSSHLEYQFACSAPETASTSRAVSVQEYFNGNLDWYQFSAQNLDPNYHGTGLIQSNPDPSLITQETIELIPFPLRFAGMPNARWWEFEDRQVDLGSLEANTTELAKLLVAEFALVTSNDWLLIPLELPAGSISEVQHLVITDVFGQRTQINPAKTLADQSWNGFRLFDVNGFDPSGESSHLLVPNPPANKLEASAFEQVNFIRDEIGNLVWGIETLVPDGWGGGRDGTEVANQTLAYYSTENSNPTSSNAKFRYLIASQAVPENCIPFIPVHKASFVNSRDIQLQRAAMPRFEPGVPTENLNRTRPRTSLLRVGFDAQGEPGSPYYIFEEEVSKIGTTISKSWQRTRGADGRPLVWIGKRRGYGKQTRKVNLTFDLIEQSVDLP
jgi:hypothetical protein